MITMTLICNLGMSTSMLVDKISDLAKKQNLEIDIDATASDKAGPRLERTDILLFGPQVRHLLPQFKKKYEGKIPVIDSINISDYGLMNGEKILKESLAKLEAAKK
jgi:PTS system cellobiose-specific IIB component